MWRPGQWAIKKKPCQGPEGNRGSVSSGWLRSGIFSTGRHDRRPRRSGRRPVECRSDTIAPLEFAPDESAVSSGSHGSLPEVTPSGIFFSTSSIND